MAKYSNTKAKINEKITTNSAQAISGNVLNEVLQTMVDSLGADYQFGGLVQPGSTFTAGEQPVVFLATTPGTYTNFGGIVVADGEVALLVWSGTAWSKQTPDIATRTEVSQLGQLLADGYLFKGVATPNTNPGTPDHNVFYIATEVGTYVNFSNLTVGYGQLAILYYNSAWNKAETSISAIEDAFYNKTNAIGVFDLSNRKFTKGDRYDYSNNTITTVSASNYAYGEIDLTNYRNKILRLRVQDNDQKQKYYCAFTYLELSDNTIIDLSTAGSSIVLGLDLTQHFAKIKIPANATKLYMSRLNMSQVLFLSCLPSLLQYSDTDELFEELSEKLPHNTQKGDLAVFGENDKIVDSKIDLGNLSDYIYGRIPNFDLLSVTKNYTEQSGKMWIQYPKYHLFHISVIQYYTNSANKTTTFYKVTYNEGDATATYELIISNTATQVGLQTVNVDVDLDHNQFIAMGGYVCYGSNNGTSDRLLTVINESTATVGPRVMTQDVLFNAYTKSPEDPNQKIKSETIEYFTVKVGGKPWLQNDEMAQIDADAVITRPLYDDYCMYSQPNCENAPVKLVVYCHGSSNYVGPDSYAMPTPLVALKQLGYAILVCNCYPYDYMHGVLGIGTGALTESSPNGNWTIVEAYTRALEYVLNKYNIDEKSMYLFGISQGGLSALNLSDLSMFKFKAEAVMCPVVSIKFTDTQLATAQTLGMYGFNTVAGYTPEKVHGCDAFPRNVDGDINLVLESTYAECVAIANKKYRRGGPLLIVHGDNDEYVHYKWSVAYAKMLKNANMACQYMLYHGYDHAGIQGGNYATINGYNIGAPTVTIARWFERFGGYSTDAIIINP